LLQPPAARVTAVWPAGVSVPSRTRTDGVNNAALS